MIYTIRARSIVLGAIAAVAAAWCAVNVMADGPGQSFTLLQSPFTQRLHGASHDLSDPDFGILGGVAFAPDGDVWSSECVFSGTRLHRFDGQTTTTTNGTDIHPETVVQTEGGCGLVNHPDTSLYSNSSDGIWQLNADSGAAIRLVPESPAGNALGIAVDPKPGAGNHLVYVGADCHPSLSPDSPTCTIYDVDPATNAAHVFARVTTARMAMVDGLYFDPTGSFLFAAERDPSRALAVIARPTTLKPLDAAVDDTQIVQQVAMSAEPDGVAFHATQGFVVTLNESDDGPGTAGTMTRFDFPGGNFAMAPAETTFASGGFRGDLLQVGGDGCIYATQGPLFQSGGVNGARYDDGTETAENSIVKICGGFVPPPAHIPEPVPGSISGFAYHDLNNNGVKDSGEPGIGGVTIALAGGAPASISTAPDGSYTFAQLPAGGYSVSAPANAGNKYRSTPSPLDIALAAGQLSADNDFGYVSIVGTTPTITYSGQATAINATVAGVTRVFADTGPVPATGGAQQESVAAVSVPGLVSAVSLSASTNAGAGHSQSNASVSSLNLTVFGHHITASLANSFATAACGVNGPSIQGGSQVTSLVVDNQSIALHGVPNEVVALPLGAGQVVIDERELSSAGSAAAITVTALHVTLTSALGTSDVRIASSHADIDCNAATICVRPPRFSGQATVVDASVLGLTTRISDTGGLPAEGGTRRSVLVSANIPGFLSANVLDATTTGGGAASHSTASVANLGLTVAGISVAANVLSSNAAASCGVAGPSVGGSSQVLALAINGLSISVTGQPNQTVTLPAGLGKIVINEQIASAAGNWSAITVNALHVYATNVGDVAIASSHSDIACTPPARTYGGQGTVVDATVLDFTTRASDTGPLPSWGGSLRSALPTVSVAGLVTASLLSATTTGAGDASVTNTSASNVGITVAGITIGATVLKSNAQAMCTGSVASVTGSSQVVSLKINGIPILVSGRPNQVVPLIVGQLILNEKVASASGANGDITVNAIHIKILGIADIALSASHADISCTALPPCPP